MLKFDYSLLSSINDDIATIKSYDELFYRIFEKLHDICGLEVGGISLIDKKNENIGFIVAYNEDFNMPFVDSILWHKTYPLSECPFPLPYNSSKVIAVDISVLSAFAKLTPEQPALSEIAEKLNLQKALIIPMQTGGQFMGFLTLAFSDYIFSDGDKEFLLKFSNLIASAINNARIYEGLRRSEEEKDLRLSLLNTLISIDDKHEMYKAFVYQIDRQMPFDYIVLSGGLNEIDESIFFCYAKDEKGEFRQVPASRLMTQAISQLYAKLSSEPENDFIEFSGSRFSRLISQNSYFNNLNEKIGISSLLHLQYMVKNIGGLNLILGRKSPFTPTRQIVDFEQLIWQKTDSYFSTAEIEFGIHLLPQLGLILANAITFEERNFLAKKLQQEKDYLLEEINLPGSFQEIIGNSYSLQTALNKVRQAAPYDTTILIQGETGTGKELFARAVHNLSGRKNNAYITVNCAALPAQLIESELFGHEKGSFTGAIERKIGKFEVANGGTIFLDEIGEIPLEIQAKLLRVLQEKEFERLGGKSTIYSDVRIVAATNRDLEKEVQSGRFRQDLYFRLNVFPIAIPPLRERAEDIPLLVKHFTEIFSKKVGRSVKSIKKDDMDLLISYSWPGNIRELEHLAERAILVSEGPTLNFGSLLGGSIKNPELERETFKTLEEMEKEHIMNALRISNGKVTGDRSASELLGINGKTLGSKMRKLGIRREISIRAI
jgi:transcriptional regulator with GAF, ATPase, and Fis domain